MKKILVTGKGSYIGTHFIEELSKYPDKYQASELEMRDENWKQHDFSQYDVVYHVAGIAHIKEVPKNKQLYFKVNRDLAVEVAKKAKKSGVKQFVFMSSMSVYGLNHYHKFITKETECKPNTYYGISKYQAEQQIKKLEDPSFKVCILRPPMVYGEGAPGNLEKLFSAVRKFHVFPTITNQRSSIAVGKLCECIKGCIDENREGIYFPQNNKYMCTVDTVRERMNTENVKVFYISFFNPIIKLMIGRVGVITKCFGDLVYER